MTKWLVTKAEEYLQELELLDTTCKQLQERWEALKLQLSDKQKVRTPTAACSPHLPARPCAHSLHLRSGSLARPPDCLPHLPARPLAHSLHLCWGSLTNLPRPHAPPARPPTPCLIARLPACPTCAPARSPDLHARP